jgi:alpha-tubulin suppressor-like RCC1 family protein
VVSLNDATIGATGGTLTNDGLISFGGTSDSDASTSTANDAGGTLQVNAPVSLEGSLTNNDDLQIGVNGSSLSCFSSCSVTEGSHSTTTLEISGPPSDSSDFGQINAPVDVAGSVDPTLQGYTPTVGAEYPVINGSYTGTFSSVSQGFIADYSNPADVGLIYQSTTPSPTSTELTSSANPSSVGESVTFTATVSPTPDDGGTVTFYDGTDEIGTAVTSDGTANLATSNLSEGSHSISATYAGDPDFASSTGSLTQQVNPAPTSTVLTSSANPSSFGQTVIFTATVSPVPDGGGAVTFYDGSTEIGSSVTSSGTAQIQTSNLAVGSHPLSATYAGDSNFGPSTGSLTQQVNPDATSTSLTTSLSPSTFGQTVTFTARVSPIPGDGGTVTFYDGSTEIGAAPTSTGVASVSTSGLSVGFHTISATFTGETDFASSSGSLTQQVNPAAYLYTTGYNLDGQLGIGESTGPETCDPASDPCSPQPMTPQLPQGVTAGAIVAAGVDAYTIGSDGNVYAWGNNSVGQLGDGTFDGPDGCDTNEACSTVPVKVDLPAPAIPVSQVVTAGGDTLALGANGNVYGWGLDTFGELGNGFNAPPASCQQPEDSAEVYCPTPVVVALPGGVSASQVAINDHAGYALASDGTVYAWGLDEYGEIGSGATLPDDDSYTPTAVDLPTGVTATGIWADNYSAFADGSDGNTYAWGLNNNGQLGHGENPSLDASDEPDYSISTPWRVDLPAGVQISVLQLTAAYTTYAIGTDQHIYVWGYNTGVDFANGSTQGSTVPETVPLPGGEAATSVAAALSNGTIVPSVYVIGANGDIYEWGMSVDGEFADGQVSQFLTTPTLNPWYSQAQAVAAGTSLLLAEAVFTPPFDLAANSLQSEEDVPQTFDLATISPTASTPANDTYTASINWGDGSPDSADTIVSDGSGSFTVAGTHSYASTGNFQVTVTVSDPGYTGDIASTARVGAPPKPSLTHVAPASLGQGASATLTLTGQNFTDNGSAEVTFSNQGVTPSTVTFISSTELQVNVMVAKNATTGTSNVTVMTPGGNDTLDHCLTVDVGPKVTSVSGRLHVGSMTTITVSGTGFHTGLTVTTSIPGATVSAPSNVTTTSFKVTIEAPTGTAAGKYKLTVTNPNRGSSTYSRLSVN